MGKEGVLLSFTALVGMETPPTPNPSTQRADAGELKVQDQSGLHSEVRPSQRLVSKATSSWSIFYIPEWPAEGALTHTFLHYSELSSFES